MFLINGNEQHYLSANDRSIQFGDGSFTTARIVDGHICLCDMHLSRLKEACHKLFIHFDQWDILRSEMHSLAANVNIGIIKVIISRGIGGSGYSIDNCLHPNRILFIQPYPHHYENWKNLGVTLTLSKVRLGRNPMLAGIKHLNRLEQVLIRAYLDSSNANETLVLDSEGVVTECCAANLFWRKGNNVFTPRLNQAGVNGVMRQFCLIKLVQSPFHIVEVNVGPEAIWNADEVIICNAIIPIAPVCSYEDKIWRSFELYQYLSPLCEEAK